MDPNWVAQKLFPQGTEKILGGPKWSVPWLYSRWQFSKGDGSYLDGAGLWASSSMVDQRSSPAPSFGKDLKNLSHLIKADQAPIHDQPPAYADDCA
jgi:hypothetical protein